VVHSRHGPWCGREKENLHPERVRANATSLCLRMARGWMRPPFGPTLTSPWADGLTPDIWPLSGRSVLSLARIAKAVGNKELEQTALALKRALL